VVNQALGLTKKRCKKAFGGLIHGGFQWIIGNGWYLRKEVPPLFGQKLLGRVGIIFPFFWGLKAWYLLELRTNFRIFLTLKRRLFGI